MSENRFAIDVRNLTKKFGNKVVVNGIDIRVPKGKIYGFLGPNGSGKTTTIRMICGLLTPDEGEGTCLGYDLRTQSYLIKKKVGYMTQKFSFWEDLTIRENLEFTANMFSLDKVKERVDEAIAGLGLAGRAEQLAGNLSGGWKQRLALAACILHEPEILLLDEPTAGVDPKARREFWEEIRKLSDKGLTVLVSTHYMDEAERCHEIIYIADGNIISRGTVKGVIDGTKLVTFVIRGAGVSDIFKYIEHESEVVTMALFGEDLHVSGKNGIKLRELLESKAKKYDLSVEESDTSLEDAFIYYMNKSKES